MPKTIANLKLPAAGKKKMIKAARREYKAGIGWFRKA